MPCVQMRYLLFVFYPGVLSRTGCKYFHGNSTVESEEQYTKYYSDCY